MVVEERGLVACGCAGCRAKHLSRISHFHSKEVQKIVKVLSEESVCLGEGYLLSVGGGNAWYLHYWAPDQNIFHNQ